MDAVLGKMGRNFLVASFVPALAFASLSLFVFGPILPESITNHLRNTLTPFDQPVLLLLMITIVIGFGLHSLNTTVYKVMEGYFLLDRFSSISNFQKRRIQKRYNKILILTQLYEYLDQKDADYQVLERLKNQIYYLSASYQRNYPLDFDSTMPTRFGNAFRAMEIYPRQRYKMDAVLLWPRLIQIIPDGYYGKLDESNNRLTFLVNCAVLSLGMAILSGFASLYQALMLHFAQAGKLHLLYFIPVKIGATDEYTQNAYLYLFGVAIMTLLFVMFYRASIPIVIQYGDLVKSAFDLFRSSLIDALNLKKPDSYDTETSLWENMSMFIGHGLLNENMYSVPFDYPTGIQDNGKDEEE